MLEKCVTVRRAVLARELKQLGQKRILVLRSFKLYRVYKLKLSFYRDTLFSFGQFVKL